MRADEIRVEWDEDGLLLNITTDEGDPYRFVVTYPERFAQAVTAATWDWLAEMEDARRSMPARDEEGAYALSSPKHPRHHEVFADIATKEPTE